jgi:glutaredoxin
MILRLVVVLVVIGLVLLARVALARRARWSASAPLPGARFPRWVTEGAERTWVVFTTPYCAACGPIVEALHRDDPAARVVEVDATRHVDLARDFSVRAAPTVFEADGDGTPLRRFGGTRDLQAAIIA